MRTRFTSCEIKTSEGGIIEGYASRFDTDPDSVGDVVAPGSFASSLDKRMPKMLWQHNQSKPMGVWDSAVEDDVGLHVRGRIALDTTVGREAYSLLKMGAVDGLSIGFQTVSADAASRDDNYERRLTAVELYEISIVTMPAQPSALITNVKSIRDWERFLRDAGGLSHRDAKRFIASGYKGMLRDGSSATDHHRDDDDIVDVDDSIAELIRNFGR